MPDEQLVEELAEAMHIACDGATCDCDRGAREEFYVSARVALASLAERGRLVPDGASICDEYGTHNGVREHRRVITTPWAVEEETDADT